MWLTPPFQRQHSRCSLGKRSVLQCQWLGTPLSPVFPVFLSGVRKNILELPDCWVHSHHLGSCSEADTGSVGKGCIWDSAFPRSFQWHLCTGPSDHNWATGNYAVLLLCWLPDVPNLSCGICAVARDRSIKVTIRWGQWKLWEVIA